MQPTLRTLQKFGLFSAAGIALVNQALWLNFSGFSSNKCCINPYITCQIIANLPTLKSSVILNF